MTDQKFAAPFVLTLMILLFLSTQAMANRAIKVKIRTDESVSSPVLETVNLYGASHALVIGIDKYTNGWPILSGAVNDARLVADALKKRGFNVILKINLNADALQRELKNFFVTKGADPRARLFVWFAGHGHTLKGQGYLIPADAPRPGQKVAFKLKALPMRRFGEYVRLAESKHAFAVFDSCFSGTIFTAQRNAPPAAVTRATTLPVRQFLSSGDADQAVSDNGLFRKLFIRAINNQEMADANRDGYITGSELGMFLTDRITNLTVSAQTPRYGKLRDPDYDRGDFVFIVPQSVLSPGQSRPLKINLPKNSEASLDDLLNESKKEQQAQVQWAGWLAVREKEVAKGRQIDNSVYLSKEKKKQAWQRILSALDQDNPYSKKDDQMRRYAMGRIDFWNKFKPEKKKIILSSGSTAGQTWTDPVTGMEFVWVPGGCFQMGSNFGGSDEKPVHEVCVDGFWMGKYEVTNRQFRLFRSSHNSKAYKGVNLNQEDRPAVLVSWNDARAYVSWLNKKGNGTFQLPSEAQWEYASRAGTITKRFWGDDSDSACQYANVHDQTSKGKFSNFTWENHNCNDGYAGTAPVGSFKSNGFGLYDMLGNVWEWCEDVYDKKAYGKHSRNNPMVTSGGSDRVIRGGSWRGRPASVRCADRGRDALDSAGSGLGFRLLRTP